MDAKDMINKYNISPVYEVGEIKIHLKPARKLTKEEIDAVVANKPAILAEFEARKAKEAEDAMHTHEVILAGWEASTIRVDDREDINTVIDEAYEAHGAWTGCSREDIAEQITKALGVSNKTAQETETEDDGDDATSFSIVETHEVTRAEGGEMGVDGRADVTLRRESDGETVRVIELNVFDFGHYAIPHAKKGTDAALDHKTWTDLETQAADWICKYGPLTCKCTRM